MISTKQLEEIINYLHSEGRNFITTREINDDNRLARYGTLDRMCKKYYKEKLTEHLLARGISFGKQGHGLNYDFDDGEHVASQYEYMFFKISKRPFSKSSSEIPFLHPSPTIIFFGFKRSVFSSNRRKRICKNDPIPILHYFFYRITYANFIRKHLF